MTLTSEVYMKYNIAFYMLSDRFVSNLIARFQDPSMQESC